MKQNSTNIKSRGFLTHPNIEIFNLCRFLEKTLMENVHSSNVYEEMVVHVIENYKFIFVCTEHKRDIISLIIHEFIAMRLREYFHQIQKLKKSNQTSQ